MFFFPLLVLQSISLSNSFQKDVLNDSEIKIQFPNAESKFDEKNKTKDFDGIQLASCGTCAVCKYNTLTNELIIAGTGATESTFTNRELVKSAKICEGITSISESFFKHSKQLTHITFPSTLKSIEDYAFYWCTKLTNVSLPDGLTKLGVYAFYLTDISSIVLPLGITEIPAHCFANSRMKSINFHENLRSIGEFAFFFNEFVSIHLPASLQTIGPLAFARSTALTTITVDSNNQYFKLIDNVLFTKDGSILVLYPARNPNTAYIVPTTVESISSMAFGQTMTLKHVQLPSSVRILDNSVFEDSSLETISLNEGLLRMSIAVFENSSLTSILIPSTVKYIGLFCFSKCKSLVSIEVEPSNQFYKSVDKVLYTKDESTLIAFPALKNVVNYSVLSPVSIIFSYAFSCSQNLMNVFLPSGVKTVGFGAFYNSSLNYINIPNTTTSIEVAAFSHSKLTKILIPNNVEKITNHTFSHCQSLTNVTLLEGITSIDNGAFDSCIKLASIVIPKSVKTIASDAFRSCTSLTSLIISFGVTSIDSFAFSKCQSLSTVFIPSSVKILGKHCFEYCSALTQLNLSEGMTTLGDYCFMNCQKLPEVIIPTKLTTISSYCFYFCSALKSVSIPNSITTINASGFESCTSLSFVEIPRSVTSIGTKAFYWCTALTEIRVSSLNTKYKSIDGVLFSITSNSLMVYPSNKSAVSYSIPFGTIQVEQYAFSYCKYITTISIPNTANKFSSRSFEFCRVLANCYYYGICDPQVLNTFYQCYFLRVVYVTPQYIGDRFCSINIATFSPSTSHPQLHTPSLLFTASFQFTKSNTFDMKNSLPFTMSSHFSSQSDLDTSEPISIFRVETYTHTKSLPQQTTVSYAQSSINEETHSSIEIANDENDKNIGKNCQKSKTQIVIIVGVVVGTVAFYAGVIIGVLCCGPISIVRIVNEEVETGSIDSNVSINTDSISDNFDPFQVDQA